MTTGSVVRHKLCPSCGQPFECYAGGCWCDDVPLTAEMRAPLRDRYDDCLCAVCLRAARGSKDQQTTEF